MIRNLIRNLPVISCSLLLLMLLTVGEANSTTIVLNPTHDSYVDEYLPTSINGAKNWLIARRGGTGFTLSTLLKFDLSSIPDYSLISSATLRLHFYAWLDGDPAGKELTVHQITGSWDESTVDWNTRPAFDASAISSSTVPGAVDSWMEWDLTSSVQSIIGGTVANNGWQIVDPSTSGYYSMIDFRSKEYGSFMPELEINYVTGTWSERVLISSGTDDWVHPQVAVYNDNVHVVWRNASASILNYRRSTDGGTTWNEIITLRTGAEGIIRSPRVAAFGDYVHVIWEETTDNYVKYRRSYTNGAIFEATYSISTGQYPDVAAEDDYVYLVYLNLSSSTDVIFIRSATQGYDWTYGPINLTGDGNTELEETPRIACSGSNVYIVWSEDHSEVSNQYSYFKRSTDNGTTWPSILTPYLAPIGTYDYISIAATGQYVFYDRDDPSGAMQRISTNSGQSFPGGAIYLGSSSPDIGPEVDASDFYSAHGCNIYIEKQTSQLCHLIMTPGNGIETVVDFVYGSSPSADVGVNANGDIHIAASSRESEGVPPYKIYYYKYGFEVCDCEPGEVDGVPPINILDIVYLINYKYKSGPAPIPYEFCNGDPNCDCQVNILDIVYLINYKYKNGPIPCDCDDWVTECGTLN